MAASPGSATADNGMANQAAPHHNDNLFDIKNRMRAFLIAQALKSASVSFLRVTTGVQMPSKANRGDTLLRSPQSVVIFARYRRSPARSFVQLFDGDSKLIEGHRPFQQDLMKLTQVEIALPRRVSGVLPNAQPADLSDSCIRMPDRHAQYRLTSASI